MELNELIMSLSGISAPSGFEKPAAEYISERVRPMVDEISIDIMGNIIAYKRCGKLGAPILMLEAHLDEIGLIVTGYDKGTLCFSSLGGVDPRMLPGLELRVCAPIPCYGVIDALPPHALSADEMEKAFPADKLRINVGLTDEEAKARIPLGTPVVFASGCTELGEKCICGKSLDDRACAAILIKTLQNVYQENLDMDLCLLFAVQEEVGGRGATTASFAVNPQYAVAVDVTHAHTPDAKKSETMVFGKGPAIAVGPNINPIMSDALFRLAKEMDISYQTEVISGNSGTDGWEIQISREGVSTAVLSLPLRYMHTPVEMISVDDAEATVKLLSELVKRAGEVL